jgi:hypothetical protein
MREPGAITSASIVANYACYVVRASLRLQSLQRTHASLTVPSPQCTRVPKRVRLSDRSDLNQVACAYALKTDFSPQQ